MSLHNQTQSIKSSSNVLSLEIASCIWVRFTQKRGITNQDAPSEDLENDPFLDSALQRFICELYYRFGSFLAPLSVGIITSRHYLSECSKNGGTSGTSGTSEDNENEQKLINLE